MPTVVYRRQDPLEFTPYEPLDLEPGSTIHRFSSMNEACDSYFQAKLSRIRLESLQVNLRRIIQEHLNRAYKKRFLQEGDLNKAQENEKYKTWGELLTAYAHQFKKGDTNAVILDFYSGREIDLPLDPRYTPIQNAQRYFKIYNKSRGAQNHLQRLMADNQQLIDYLETVMVAVNQADSPSAVEEIVEELEKEKIVKTSVTRKQSKANPSQPRKFVSSDGLTILVGRNNRQNDRLTLKQANKGDLWLHTQQIPGTHVIISLPPNISTIDEVPETTLLEAAALAAHYSQAAKSAKVPVDYTFRQNVKKPGGAKPGMVIYENYWTVMVDPGTKQLDEWLNQVN